MGVLRHGELFAVFDRHGDAIASDGGSHGFYYDGTRFLSNFELRVDGRRPALLGSALRDDHALLTVDLSNPGSSVGDQCPVPRDTLHVYRSRFAYDNTFYETLRVTNHGTEAATVTLSLAIDADFADIFEVRGIERERRGRMLESRVEGRCVMLRYEGLDDRVRSTVLRFDPKPRVLTESDVRYTVRLEPKEEHEMKMTISCMLDAQDPRGRPVRDHGEAFQWTRRELDHLRTVGCTIRTSNESFNDWITRSASDLRMMTSRTKDGMYPYAGVPWFNAVFGRDGIITAREMLWVDPSLARGVLRTLAATQSKEWSDARDAEPGKIVHEMRRGEMATLGEVPYGCYYGTADATPLFVMLARDYWGATGDIETIRKLWPSILDALAWIDEHGDADGDGFVEYERRAGRGPLHQGWKDSADSVFHANGEAAEGAIALCEVQAYAYAARKAVSELASLLGEAERSQHERVAAERFRERFLDRFWCADLGTFALALDGEKRLCRVKTSNAGHCLFAGVATEQQAAAVSANLMAADSFSGWGIRTVSAQERRYNPMSYHNGSVWPHDTAIAAAGMARYGQRGPVVKLIEGLFRASVFMDMHRLPELFCGFHSRPGQGPTLYPMACAPQAWAAGSVFLLLQAVLGLEVHGASRTLLFRRPVMPAGLEWISFEGLRVGDARVDLLLRRSARKGVAIEALQKDGDANIQVTESL
jgi:glycogen debranching enzyme